MKNILIYKICFLRTITDCKPHVYKTPCHCPLQLKIRVKEITQLPVLFYFIFKCSFHFDVHRKIFSWMKIRYKLVLYFVCVCVCVCVSVPCYNFTLIRHFPGSEATFFLLIVYVGIQYCAYSTLCSY